MWKKSQERTPARIDLAWRGADPTGGEDATDGAGADPMAEPDQFALDAPVAPSWILPSKAEHEIT